MSTSEEKAQPKDTTGLTVNTELPLDVPEVAVSSISLQAEEYVDTIHFTHRAVLHVTNLHSGSAVAAAAAAAASPSSAEDDAGTASAANLPPSTPTTPSASEESNSKGTEQSVVDGAAAPAYPPHARSHIPTKTKVPGIASSPKTNKAKAASSSKLLSGISDSKSTAASRAHAKSSSSASLHTTSSSGSRRREHSPSKIPVRRALHTGSTAIASSTSSSSSSSASSTGVRKRVATVSASAAAPHTRTRSPSKRSFSPSKHGASVRNRSKTVGTNGNKSGTGSSSKLKKPAAARGMKRTRSINLLFQPEPLSDEEVEDGVDHKGGGGVSPRKATTPSSTTTAATTAAASSSSPSGKASRGKAKSRTRLLPRRRSLLVLPDDKPPDDHSPELWKIFSEHEEFQKQWDATRFDHGDVHFRERMTVYVGLEERLQALDHSKLSEADQLNFKAFLPFITIAKEDCTHSQWQFNCTVRKGPHMAYVNFCRKFKFRDKTDMKRWTDAADMFAKACQLRVRLWREAAKAKRTMPLFVVRGLVAQLAGQLRPSTESSAWYRPIKALNLPDSPADSSLYAQIRAHSIRVIEETVRPAIEAMKKYLEREYMPACTKRAGLWAIPGGSEYYAYLVRAFTTEAEITPHVVHEIGVREVKRLKGEITALFTKMGHTRSSFAELIEVVEDSKEYFFAKGESPLKEYKKFLESIKPKLPQYFGREPSNKIVVRAMQSATAAAALYALGDPGIFFVNTLEPEQRPKYMVPAIALHEGVGHHYQLSLAHEMKGVPEFRRKRGLNVAFAEGWGVYLEGLGEEMGAYTSDIMQLGRLNGEILRASRLVVETGIHVRHWSRTTAVQWLKGHTFLKAVELDSEVDRAILTPGHGLAYTIGLLKIRELREMATKVLGDHFDLRQFHDVMLSEGALPLHLLDDYLCKWMKTEALKHGVSEESVDSVFEARKNAQAQLQSTAEAEARATMQKSASGEVGAVVEEDSKVLAADTGAHVGEIGAIAVVVTETQQSSTVLNTATAETTDGDNSVSSETPAVLNP